MALKERVSKKRREEVAARRKLKIENTKRRADTNELRRKKRASSTEYRNRISSKQTAKRSRDRKSKAKKETLLSNGILYDGVDRQVQVPDHGLEIVECFTLNEAGKALGKTLLTIRNWIEAGSIPEPILVDVTYGYSQYSAGELGVIAEILDEHFKEYSQLQRNHEVTVRRIHVAVGKYRQDFI